MIEKGKEGRREREWVRDKIGRHRENIREWEGKREKARERSTQFGGSINELKMAEFRNYEKTEYFLGDIEELMFLLIQDLIMLDVSELMLVVKISYVFFSVKDG